LTALRAISTLACTFLFPLEPNDYAKTPLVDRHVPLFHLVYHGIILSNPFTGTLNYPVKAPNGSSGPSV
jgi:hypothetical protein